MDGAVVRTMLLPPSNVAWVLILMLIPYAG